MFTHTNLTLFLKTETQNCIKSNTIDEKSETYKQCLVDSRKKYDDLFDQCLGFYDQELPYVNPLMKKFVDENTPKY